MGLKVLVSGQTVGPVLTGPDSGETAEALRLCDAVGSRERHTYDLLSSLDVQSVQVLDDAAFFAQDGAIEALEVPAAGYIAATFAPASGAMPRNDYHRHMARLLDLAYEHLQLPILLLPHVSTFGSQDGDQECHAAIARLSKAPNIRVLDQNSAEETAALTAKAELIISSRYHPVVFGLSAGVPVLAVAVDYYWKTGASGRSSVRCAISTTEATLSGSIPSSVSGRKLGLTFSSRSRHWTPSTAAGGMPWPPSSMADRCRKEPRSRKYTAASR
jgi:polysaccharide pyruvyl transferase WcaK-like protein